MMKQPWVLLGSLGLVVLAIYFFVTAPSPLPEANQQAEATIPVERALAILQAENAVVRALWTRAIVTPGQKAGLAFREDWRPPGMDAGPLPAVFLRETAMALERDPVELSLFLGSDSPINDANLFSGIQQEKFVLIRQTGQPQFFYDSSSQRYTAMFADLALVQGCVDCHNKHEQSPKKDWALQDTMGATTWLYPKEAVSLSEMLTLITALHVGVAETYAAYLDKAATFANPPTIGEQWPSEGYYVPSLEVFMREVRLQTSPLTLETLLDVTRPAEAAQ